MKKATFDPFKKLAYKVLPDGTRLTKSQWIEREHRKEAKEIIRLDSRAEKVRKMIDAMSDDGSIRHAHAIPIRLRKKPSPKELEIGIPVCCNHEPMQVSAFTEGIWYCRICKNTRLR